MYQSKDIYALAIASISFGTSAIFVRFATEATALSLTFFRLSLAAIVMILFAYQRKALIPLARKQIVLVVLAGLVLSLHFATFILAVKFTTVANATFLVNTSPVMLAVLAPIMIKERTTFRESIGVITATIGVLFVANAGSGFRYFSLADASALLAAFLISLYTMLGRSLRTQGVSTACYTAYVYSTAAIVGFSLAEMFGSNMFRTYDTTNLVAILGLAIVPTMLGHSLYNYSLGAVKTVTANLFPLLEPIIASVFAVFLFREIPTIIQLFGYLLILTAVAVVVTSQSKI
ncbi:MAG: EamA family transporter [Candidatus Bathyarchaeia archaeon]